MMYYKIPISESCFDFPAGCILCCGYPLNGYYYCKFEAVPDDGPDWVKITAEEFEANCPDFSVDLPDDPPADAGSGVLTAVDFSNFENGSFTETVDGEEIPHAVTFDENGKPVKIDDISITWGY